MSCVPRYYEVIDHHTEALKRYPNQVFNGYTMVHILIMHSYNNAFINRRDWLQRANLRGGSQARNLEHRDRVQKCGTRRNHPSLCIFWEESENPPYVGG